MTEPTSEEARTPFTSRETWVRGLITLLFIVIFHVVEWVVVAMAVLQFLFTLFTGKANSRLASFGEGLGRYAYQVARYLAVATEEKPFPFADWPGAAPPAPGQP